MTQKWHTMLEGLSN